MSSSPQVILQCSIRIPHHRFLERCIPFFQLHCLFNVRMTRPLCCRAASSYCAGENRPEAWERMKRWSLLAQYAIEVGDELAVKAIYDEPRSSLLSWMEREQCWKLRIGSKVFKKFIADQRLIYTCQPFSGISIGQNGYLHT